MLDESVTPFPPPKAMTSAAPTTVFIPEGLLTDLDDDNLDTPSQPTPNPVTPLRMEFLSLDDNNGDDNDNASDSGTVSPPRPLTRTTSDYSESASSVTLSAATSGSDSDDTDNTSDGGTISPAGPLTPTTNDYAGAAAGLAIYTTANRSVDTSMQATPTSDVPDISGLTPDLGDQRMSDETINYDALRLIADLLGLDTPPPPNDSSGQNDADDGTVDPSCFVGKVELVRKRVAQDGRVKLKMSLLGVAVEKCAICMTQFKADDTSTLGATCNHAFHEKCLEKWLDRSQTCPLCRERLDAY